MGAYCSIDKEPGRHVEKSSQVLMRSPSKLVKKQPHHLSTRAMALASANKDSIDGAQYDNLDALDRFLGTRDAAQFFTVPDVASAMDDRDRYWQLRKQMVDREHGLAFDWACQHAASPDELTADEIIQLLKLEDRRDVYGEDVGDDGQAVRTISPRRGYGGQEHPHFYGDHFLSSVDLIGQTKLFKIAHAMPKGAHLHIHFNANLVPAFLLEIAREMKQMFITSDLPLTSEVNFDRCEIQFSIIAERNVDAEPGQGNLFAADYATGQRRRMRFADFLNEFDSHFRAIMAPMRNQQLERLERRNKSLAMQWLEEKLVFHEDEAHSVHQTAKGAWEKFNGRTRMMKGLFNYETAYRKYTKECLEEFVQENILYAEIRPNFMKTNQVWTDDGEGQMNNYQIMELIIHEYKTFQEYLRKRREERRALEERRRAGRRYTKDQEDLLKGPCYFGGLKIIYCTPRSFEPGDVQIALEECGRFYNNPEFRPYLAGFDLVGEEGAKKYPLKNFINEFIAFRKQFSAEQIPFLFHCGETLEMGNDTDGNLVDALLLDSKRIGHGVALARHPYIMEQMKKRGVCLELCPISNEILGLAPRVNGHPMYNLLANNVHCTVSSDNPTLFRSTLSHDFYQVMAGKTDMTLFGWKQLIKWSLEHSCMSNEERDAVTRQWERHWDVFARWITETDWTQPIENIPFPDAPLPDAGTEP